MADPRPGDPADRAVDAKADGAFGGLTNHRGGYGDDKLARLTEWLRAHPTATLASGEGALLLAEIDRLRVRCRQIDDEAYDYAEQIEQLKAEIDRQRRILAALREPSQQVKKAVGRDEFMRLFTGEWETIPVGYDLTAAMILAAVAAAEQEVGRE